MIKPEVYWISSKQKIDDIINIKDVIFFEWSKNYSDDYIKLSESFYLAAQIIITEINNHYSDNVKCDQWFFPALYLYRQAIELLCKGLLMSVIPQKYITNKLKDYKHNIFGLFNEYISISSFDILNTNELFWILSYLSDLEKIDSTSNLFRYPIKEGYLSKFKNNFLDIVDMTNSIEQCYSLIFKCVNIKFNPIKYSTNIDLKLIPKVLFFSIHGFGNCMLYTSQWDEGYYTHIEGYSDIAYFLLNKMEKNHLSFLPIAFLIRHAIELSLKYMLMSRTEINVSKQIQLKNRKSHILYEDLWKNIEDMIKYYANSMGYDLNVIHCADIYLSELSSLDKKGDYFRYPTDYGLNYHLKLTKIDYYHSVYWFIGIFNFVNGCSQMLDAAYEYENNMKYES